LTRADLQAAWEYAAAHPAEIENAIRRHKEWKEEQEKGNKRKMLLICTILLAVANYIIGSGVAEDIAGPETAWVGGCTAAFIFVGSVVLIFLKIDQDRRQLFCLLGCAGFLLMLFGGGWVVTRTELRSSGPVGRLLIWVISMAGMFGGFAFA